MAGSAPARGTPDLISVLLGFGVADTIVSATPVGGGHLHNTWSVPVTDQSREFGFILQELNGAVFPDLAACEENLRRIDDHWHSREKTGAIAVPSSNSPVATSKTTVSPTARHAGSTPTVHGSRSPSSPTTSPTGP